LPASADAAGRRKGLVLAADDHAAVLMNRYPYAHAHLMVGLHEESGRAVQRWLQRSIRALQSVYAPQGFNVGANLGRVGGAGIADHLHWHVVPRWEGDTNFMPMLADTRVMPQHIEEAYDRLLPQFS
jgi:ATP adenylyltransferase